VPVAAVSSSRADAKKRERRKIYCMMMIDLQGHAAAAAAAAAVLRMSLFVERSLPSPDADGHTGRLPVMYMQSLRSYND